MFLITLLWVDFNDLDTVQLNTLKLNIELLKLLMPLAVSRKFNLKTRSTVS